MLKVKTVEEILRFALDKEKWSCDFYDDLSKAVNDPIAQGVFTALAKEEIRHISAIEMEIFKMGYTLKSEEDDESKPRRTLDEETRNMTFLDAIQLAISKEQTAFRLFVELMTMTENQEVRGVLMGLAKEEMRHMIRLEEEYNTFTSKRGHSN